MKNAILFPALMALVLCSCEKEEDDNTDKEAPKITIIAPTDSSQAMSGMPMHIMASVSDNEQLHEIHVEAYNSTQDSVMLHLHMHEHGQSVMVDTSFIIPDFGEHQDYVITVEARDHAGNTTKETRNKHVHL